MNDKRIKRQRRHRRVRSKIKGTAKIPRLCVFRSNKHMYAQLIDDEKGKTLISASDLDIGKKRKTPASAKASAGKKTKKELSGKAAIAYRIGQILAKKALDLPAGPPSGRRGKAGLPTGEAGKKLEKVIFDRGGYKYHGRVKALAEGARAGGLKF